MADEVEYQEITLTEFCTRLSMNDNRVEMIAGFEHAEKLAGHFKDIEPSYLSRFTVFTTKPV